MCALCIYPYSKLLLKIPAIFQAGIFVSYKYNRSLYNRGGGVYGATAA